MTDLARYAVWVTWLRGHGRIDPDVLAVWVGGSAVTGGYDEHSDLDVDVLCTPGTVDEVYARLVARVRAEFAIADLWELPEATWPDGRQCFVHMRASAGALQEPTRIVDLHLSDLADRHRFVDVRRHGRPIVLHDPEGLVVLRHDDDAQLWTSMTEAVDHVRQRRGTGEWLVNRAIRRKQWAEATELYLRFALAPVVRMLRVQHCPWRHDYGLRYLAEDLGDDLAARVEWLVPAGRLEDQSVQCFGWLDELLAAPALRGWPAPPDRAFVAAHLDVATDEVRGALSRRASTAALPHDATLTATRRGTRLTAARSGLTDPVSHVAGWHQELDQLIADLAGGDPAAAPRDSLDTLVLRYRALFERQQRY